MSGSHKQHRQAPSRRRAVRRRWWLLASGLVGSAVVLTVLMATAVSWRSGHLPAAATDCPPGAVTLAVAPEPADPVAELIADHGCSGIEVERADSATTAEFVAHGEGPDLWIPESSVWAADAEEIVTGSVARSPVVLVRTSGPPPRSWASALSSTDLQVGDPMSETASAAALVVGLRDLRPQAALDLVVPLAQRHLASPVAPTAASRLSRLTLTGGGVTVASEQQALAEPGLKLSAPAGGAYALDYPLIRPAASRASVAVGDWIALRLTSAEAQRRFEDLGFRVGVGAATESPDGGIGEFLPLTFLPADMRAIRDQWRLLAVPTRGLAVVDVSGSMEFGAGDRTRIQLTVEAAQRGLALFPDVANLGLWAFSAGLNGNQDHRELVPMRELRTPIGSGTQREVLAAALADLPALTGGGTGLYDTVLAAYQHVMRTRQPGSFHAVLLFTDGANDDPGSISRAELVDRLGRLTDPKRPVPVVAIGITDDADEAALRAIAKATGGASYIADRPEDISTVFLDALHPATG